MSNKTKIFSEALVEARALKETALQNAKLSLAESFAPKIQSMISNKLNEMEDDSLDESNLEEGEKSLDELLNEMEDDFAAGSDDLDMDDTTDVTDDFGDDTGDDFGTSGDDEVGEITVDELKDIIRDVMIDLEGGDTEEFSDDLGDTEFEDESDDDLELAAESVELDELSGGSIDGSNAAASGLDNLVSQVKSLAAKSPEYASKISSFLKGLPSGAGAAIRNESQIELQEVKKANKLLSETLRDVNLLNSKLLYVNKIFKAKNLSEAQKAKVINAFDRTESVKETENLYATLKESLNNYPTTKYLKESRGSASRPLGNGNRLNESVNPDQNSINRMKKLAGLI